MVRRVAAGATDTARSRPPEARPQLRRREVRLDGVRISYQVGGTGPAVVFVHGLAGSGRWWDRNIAPLMRRFTVHLIDLIGFGSSHGQQFLLHDASRDLVRWMDVLGIERASFVGHSMGGLIVAELAADQPDRVDRLVLIDSAALPLGWRYPRHFFNGIRALPAVSLRFVPIAIHDWLRAGPLAILRAARQVLASDLTAKLARIEAPALVLWGEHDPLIPAETGERLARLIPGARFELIRGAAHNTMWERPEPVNELLLDFLAAPAPPPPRGATPGDESPPEPVEPAELVSRYVALDGVTLHVRSGGAGAPQGHPPIVLVHGLVISSRSVAPTAARLARHWRVLAPDLPGFGWSSSPPRVLDVPQLADTVVRLLDRLELHRVVLLGSSFGCQVVADIAARHPDRVERLILVSPTFDPCVRAPVAHLWRVLRNAPREDFFLWLLHLPDYILAGVPRAVATLRHGLRDRIEAKLPLIEAPTLVVRGSRDALVPRRWALGAASLVRQGRMAEIPGAAHAVAYTRPLELSELIERFARN